MTYNNYPQREEKDNLQLPTGKLGDVYSRLANDIKTGIVGGNLASQVENFKRNNAEPVTAPIEQPTAPIEQPVTEPVRNVAPMPSIDKLKNKVADLIDKGVTELQASDAAKIYDTIRPLFTNKEDNQEVK